MTALVFVDTNVFAYRHDNGDPAKQARADEWIAHLALPDLQHGHEFAELRVVNPFRDDDGGGVREASREGGAGRGAGDRGRRGDGSSIFTGCCESDANARSPAVNRRAGVRGTAS